MAFFMAVVLGLIGILHNTLSRIFYHSPAINAVIFGVFFVGVGWAFLQMLRLNREQGWLLGLEKGLNKPFTPRLLQPLAITVKEPSYTGTLPTLAARSLLVSIEERLDETRDVNRYVMGLLVFLGLLGTFWGLSQTIGSIANVIGGLDISGAKVEEAFQTMKMGLQSPLAGMGTAFSCSMFGLAGSLIVGFLDLQYGKAASAFYRNLEDKIATITRHSTAAEGGAYSGPAYNQGLLEQTVESMASVVGLMRQGEDNRTSLVKSLNLFSEKLSHMADQMASHQIIMKKIAQNHIDLQENLMQVVKASHNTENQETVKNTLRTIELTSTKLLEEMVEGRNRTTQELRAEIRLVARTLSALANGQDIAA
jgi:hypothetical protein